MTTLQVETEADRGNISTGNMNLKVALRRSVIPMFLEDVGLVGWRRRSTSISTVAGTRTYALPADFHQIENVYSFISGSERAMYYVGEDPELVAAAEIATDNAYPEGYYIKLTTTGTISWKLLALSAPSDGVYSLPILYYAYIPFADDTSTVDLSGYIPENYHYALVDALRADIYLDRYGEGDNRYQAAMQKYMRWIGHIRGTRELAARKRAIFVR